MADTIIARVRRIIAAHLEDAVDLRERAGGTSVMREAIREVERIIDQVCAEHSAATARQYQSARQARMFRDRLAGLDEKARFALAEGREDLAEAAISRQLDFEAQAVLLEKAAAEAQAEVSQLEDSLTALRSRKGQMEDELAAVAAKQSVVDGEYAPAPRSATDAGRRVEQAESAFQRALSGIGGEAPPGIGDIQGAAKVAEIDTLQKRITIARRIAQLRGGPVAVQPS